MPRLTRSVPKLSKKTVNGICYAIVRIAGEIHHCGLWNTRAARAQYDALIAEWLQEGRPSVRRRPEDQTTVAQVVAEFWKWAKSNMRPDVARDFKPILRDLRQKYGHRDVGKFGPKSLKALRQGFLDAGASRKHANRKATTIKRVFRWAVAEELCPVEVYQRLATVAGLREGQGDARETEPVEPVSLADFEATIPHLPPVVADLLRLQLYTGARPGEICDLTPGQVEATGDVWEYRPKSHKNKHRGKGRVILIGPRGQDVLRKYLLRPSDSRCFRPCDSEKDRRAALREDRVTPESCGNKPGTNRKVKPKRKPGEAYTAESLTRAIRRAVDKLNKEREAAGMPLVERWTANRLRHSAGTLLRQKFGLEAAQAVLGHARADTTQIYAERDLEKARAAVAEIG